MKFLVKEEQVLEGCELRNNRVIWFRMGLSRSVIVIKGR